MADTKTTGKTARIDATHMGAGSMRDDPKPKAPPPVEKDEDWGVDAETDNEMDDLEGAEEQEVQPTNPPRGGEVQNPQTRSKTVTATEAEPTTNTTNTATESGMNADDYFAMLERLEQFKANAIGSVKEQQKKLDEEKAAFLATYDQKTAENNEKLKKLGVTVEDENEDEEPAVKKRGRRRRVSSEDGDSTPAAAKSSGNSEVGRRTRPKNDMTLKEAIVEVLTKKGRATLKTIAEEIINSGFKTNSKKFGNTVRVQLYRLDDDGEVAQYDDNTFGLKKK